MVTLGISQSRHFYSVLKMAKQKLIISPPSTCNEVSGESIGLIFWNFVDIRLKKLAISGELAYAAEAQTLHPLVKATSFHFTTNDTQR